MDKKKILLVGSGSIHLKNYHDLIENYFKNITIITNIKKYDYGKSIVYEENFSLLNPFNFFKTVSKIRKIYNQEKPDIIHIHQANAFSFVTIFSLKKYKVPIIVTAWGDDILVLPKKNIWLRKMVLFNLKNADAFTSDSLNMSAEIRKLVNIGEKPLITANFGVELNENIIYKENIIYSNRLHYKFYRIDKIILAFDKFYKKNPNWKLKIAGEGIETQNLIKIASELNCSEAVEILGWVDKKTNQELYNKSKFFVSIPTTDATSASLLEAMSSGCIPILSNLPANMEWVVDELNGIIVDNVEEDFISRSLVIDTIEGISINKKIIKNKASLDVSRKKFTDLYDILLENKK